MAHLSRNISDSENPVVSYQPSWFDDGAAAQLHRVSQLRWIDLYIYIYLSSPAGGSVLVWLAPTDELLVCWKIHTIKIDDFLSDTPPFWAGIFHPATFDYGGHVWKFWGDILRSQGHVEVDNPFSQKKKNCARQVGARTESLHANCDKETLQPLTNLTNPQMLPWFPRISVWLQPWRFSPRGLKNGKEYPSSHPPLEQEGTMKNDRVTLTSIMNFP